MDWKATFPDGVLHVEAYLPTYNASAGETAARHKRLLDVLEKRAPDGWWLLPLHLPSVSGHASLRPFRELVAALLARIPQADTVPPGVALEVHGQLPEGRVELALHRTTGRGGLGSHAMIGYMDNSRDVLREAWRDRRKRQQGRSVPSPALLAIAGSFLGPDLEDFEVALLGGDLALGLPADGVMAKERNPPWAGVLAFPRISPAGAADPVLFMAPGYRGPLPAAVERLEIRRLGPGGLDVQPAQDVDVVRGIRWAASST